VTALAIIILVGQAVTVWLLLRIVRTFGCYIEQARQVHDANLVITRSQATITYTLCALKADLDRVTGG